MNTLVPGSRLIRRLLTGAPALLLAVGGGLPLTGCTKHTVQIEPIEVKPITLNINLRVDRELDEFFDFEEELESATPEAPATTEPAPAPLPTPTSPTPTQAAS